MRLIAKHRCAGVRERNTKVWCSPICIASLSNSLSRRLLPSGQVQNYAKAEGNEMQAHWTCSLFQKSRISQPGFFKLIIPICQPICIDR